MHHQKMTAKRLVLTSRQKYFFQKKRQQSDFYINREAVDENKDNKNYVLGYN